MSRIDSFFKSLPQKGEKKRKALIPYLTVGYPSVAATLEVAPALVAGGCDMGRWCHHPTGKPPCTSTGGHTPGMP